LGVGRGSIAKPRLGPLLLRKAGLSEARRLDSIIPSTAIEWTQHFSHVTRLLLRCEL
jgi:hypothetical protein